MTRALQWQRWIFLSVATVVIVVALAFPPLDRRLQLRLLAGLVLLLGAPHGALDPVYVRAFDGVSSVGGWAVFGVGYVLLALGVVLVWLASPLVFAAGFLALSALHFSGDPPSGASVWTRAAYGIAVLALPALFHRQQVEGVFTMLIGAAGAAQVGAGLATVAPAAALAALTCAVREARRNVSAALEVAVVCALMTVAPPLVAFAVFFCGMHSPRHIIRTIDLIGGLTYRRAFQVAMWPMLVIAGCGLVGLTADSWQSLDARLTTEVFVGLAALTLPHMLVVERLRFAHRSRDRRRRPPNR